MLVCHPVCLLRAALEMQVAAARHLHSMFSAVNGQYWSYWIELWDVRLVRCMKDTTIDVTCNLNNEPICAEMSQDCHEAVSKHAAVTSVTPAIVKIDDRDRALPLQLSRSDSLALSARWLKAE